MGRPATDVFWFDTEHALPGILETVYIAFSANRTTLSSMGFINERGRWCKASGDELRQRPLYWAYDPTAFMLDIE
jgi:hypothetical protein